MEQSIDLLLEERAFQSLETYNKLQKKYISDEFESYWEKQMSSLIWHSKYDKVLDKSDNPIYKWFVNGKISPSYNLLDLNLKKKENADHVLFEVYNCDSGKIDKTYTLQYCFDEIIKLSFYLKSKGVRKGDVVGIYSPSIPESFIFIHSCHRIGAIAHGIYENFSSEELLIRLSKFKHKAIIVASARVVNGETILMFDNIAKALKLSESIHTKEVKLSSAKNVLENNGIPDITDLEVFVYQCDFHKCDNFLNIINEKKLKNNCYLLNSEIRKLVMNEIDDSPEILNSNDPISILQTSGSTGEPKFVFHTVTSLLLSAFDFKNNIFPNKLRSSKKTIGNINPSWITGHIFTSYGSLINFLETYVVIKGNPFAKGPCTYWNMIEQTGVSVTWLTAIQIRSLKVQDPEGKETKSFGLDQLKVIFTGGDLIDPFLENWFRGIISKHILFTNIYGQTENSLSTTLQFWDEVPRLGSSNIPCLGRNIQIVEGKLCLVEPFPPTFVSGFWNDYNKNFEVKNEEFINQERYKQTYYFIKDEKYYYNSGDYAKIDDDGYIYILGRDEECLKVSRTNMKIGANEIEGWLAVIEGLICSFAFEIKGESINKIGLVLKSIYSPEDPRNDDLGKKAEALLEEKFDEKGIVCLILFVRDFPKNINGKILRTLMKRLILGENYSIPHNIESVEPIEELKELVKNRHLTFSKQIYY